LVASAKNFTTSFPHIGRRGIKAILDKNKVDYSRKTIVQASDLKSKLETLGIKSNKHTSMAIDAKNMYPPVKFGQIEKAVHFFLSSASRGEKDIARRCLDCVKFGMANTIISFEDQNWIYAETHQLRSKDLQWEASNQHYLLIS